MYLSKIEIIAGRVHIKTHKPCKCHTIKKVENDFFILSNLTSFLSLFTLKNRNNPKRNVQIKIANKNISLVSISKLKLLLLIIKTE